MIRSAYLDTAEAALWARATFSFVPTRVLPPSSSADETQRTSDGGRLVFVGFPSDFSLAFLFAALRLPGDVVGLVTSPRAHPGVVAPNALDAIAAHIGVPVLRLENVNTPAAVDELASLTPDVVLMASFDQIVRLEALAVPPHGWINVHPSRLPEYRGPEPVYWAVADGCSSTAITLHRAVLPFDAGAVLAQAVVPIADGATAGTLARAIAVVGVPLVPHAVASALRDEPGRPTDMNASSYRPSVGHRQLTTASSAEEAERWVRAGAPDMPPWARIGDQPVYVRAATVVSRPTDGPVLRFADDYLRVDEWTASCSCGGTDTSCPRREIAAST